MHTVVKNMGSGGRMPASPNPGSISNQLGDPGQEFYFPALLDA